jgi:hypothetical protein
MLDTFDAFDLFDATPCSEARNFLDPALVKTVSALVCELPVLMPVNAVA